MCNNTEQIHMANECGFKNTYYINRHYNLDYNCYKADSNIEKIYDICVFGEQLGRNNIDLCFPFANDYKIVIIDGNANWNSGLQYPESIDRIPKTACGTNGLIIQETMRQSKFGLCLSQQESMCWSSLEFFYNGIPVLSSNDKTGRECWYNENNSIVIEKKDFTSISNGITDMLSNIEHNIYNPISIRKDAIRLSNMFRSNFVNMIGDIFVKYNINNDPKILFDSKYEQRMLYEAHWKNFNNTLIAIK